MSQVPNFRDNVFNNSYCFICDKELELKAFQFDICQSDRSKSRQQIYQRFRSIVSRYLNLNILEASKTLGGADPDLHCQKLKCCEPCFGIVKTVCEVYLEWKKLQLELNLNLNKIGETMKSCSKSGCYHPPDISDFKRDFRLSVESMSQAEYPHLILEKIKLSAGHKQELQNDSVSIKLENDEIEESSQVHNHDDVNEMDSEIDSEINNCVSINCEMKPELPGKLKTEMTKDVGAEKQKKLKSVSDMRNGNGTLKQFLCSFCGKLFRYRNSMRRHQRIHTGAKPYECGICGHRFSLLEGRKSHEMTHNPENRILKHNCKFCSKKFSTNQNRITHEWTHTGLKPFQCSVCSRKFNNARTAKRHIDLLHKDVKDAKFIKKFNSYKEFE